MGIKKIVDKTKYLYHCFHAITADEKSVVGDAGRMAITTKLKYMLLGFSKQDIAYYGFPKNDYRNYISTAERLKLEDLNGRFAYILGEKVMLERIWGDYINVPKTYCLIERKHFLDLSDESLEFDIVELLKKHHKLLAKPTRSCGGGHGVTSLSFIDESFLIGSKRYDEIEFIKALREYEGYLISDWITQHKYSSNVFPDSTNTIRVVTIMNPTFFKNALTPDECFFQTLFINSPFANTRKDKLMWLQWAGNHPRLIVEDDIDSLIKNNSVLFARKFDMSVNSRPIEMLLEKLREL